MAKRITKRRTRRKALSAKRRGKHGLRTKRRFKGRSRPRPIIRSRRGTRISDARLARGLQILRETSDITTAARAIRVPVESFKRAAKRKNVIRRRKHQWTVARRLPRRMPIFSNGRQLAITVRSRSAALIGRYMSAVAQFLKTNDPKLLAEFRRRGVKDVRDKVHQFETDPNVLYRLSSAGGEPFEEIYRIVL
jgi:hypothetical protein